MSCKTIYDGSYILSQEEFEKLSESSKKRVAKLSAMLDTDTYSELKSSLELVINDVHKNLKNKSYSSIQEGIKGLAEDQVNNILNRFRTQTLSPTSEDFNSAVIYAKTVVDSHMMLTVLERLTFEIADSDFKRPDGTDYTEREVIQFLNDIQSRATEVVNILSEPNVMEIITELPSDNPIRKALEDVRLINDAIHQKVMERSVNFYTEYIYENLNEDVKDNSNLKSKIKDLIKLRDYYIQAGLPKSSKEVKRLNKSINSIKKQFITKDKIKDYLLGNAEDASKYDMYLHAAILSSDPIIAPLAAKISNMKNEVYTQFKETLAVDIQDFYDDWLAFKGQDMRLNPSLETLNQDLLEWKIYEEYSIVDVVTETPTGEEDEFGEPIMDKVITKELKREVKTVLEHRDSVDSSAYYKKKELIVKEAYAKLQLLSATEETKKEREREYNKAVAEKNAFKREFFEREFTNEYYDLTAIPESVKEKYEAASQKLRQLKEDLLTLYRNDLYLEYIDAKKEFFNLSSEIDLDGNQKTGKELEDAKTLKEWKEKKKVVREEYTEEDIAEAKKDYRKHYVNKENSLRAKGVKEDQIKLIMRFFEQENSTIIFNKTFTDKRKELKEKIDSLQKQIEEYVDVTKEDSKKLWEKISDYTKSYIDGNFIPIGKFIPKKAIKEIKKINEELEELKTLKKAEKSEAYKSLTKKQKEEYKKLLKEYRNATKEYYSMVEYKTTSYYNEKIMELTSDLKNAFPDASDTEIEAKLKSSEWYVNNHYMAEVFDSSINDMVTVEKPISAWTYMDAADVDKYRDIRPSYLYFKNAYSESIKDEFKNPNYVKDRMTNSASIKKGTKYDKTSDLYEQSLKEKLALADELGSEELKQKLIDQYNRDIDVYKNNFFPELKVFIERSFNIWGDIQDIENYNSRKLGRRIGGVRKTRSEKLIENKKSFFASKEKRKKIAEQFRDLIGRTADQIEEEEFVSDDVYSELERNLVSKEKMYGDLPIRFKANLPIGEQSYNLGSIYMNFAQKDMIRRQMEKEKFIYMGIYSTLLEKGSVSTQSSVFSSLNNGENKNKTIRARHLNEIIKQQFYGEMTNEATLFGVDLNKVTNGASALTALTTLAHNYPGAIVNWLSGNVQLLLEGVRGQKLTVKDLGKGKYNFYKYFVPKLTEDDFNFREANKSWAGQFVDAFRFFQGENMESTGKRIGKSVTSSALESALFANKVRNATEYEMQGSLAVGMMINKPVYVKQEDGSYELSNLFEAYRSNKLISIKGKEGLIKQVDTSEENPKPGEDWSLKNENDFKLNIEATNIRTAGNYSKINQTVAEKNTIVRQAFLYRKYFFPFIDRRFAGASKAALPFLSKIPGMDKYVKQSTNKYKLDNASGTYRRGFYIEGVSALSYLLPAFVDSRKSVKDIYKLLDEDKQAGLKQIGADTSIVLILSLLFSMLGGDDEDEYDQYSWFRLHTLYQIRKISAETEQFTLAGAKEINNIITTPFIAHAVLYNRASNLLESTIATVAGDESAFYKRDTPGMWKKGDSKAVKDLFNLAGLRFRVSYPEKLLKDFNYAQRTR